MTDRAQIHTQNQHTIVLRPRGTRVARVQECGSNLAHFAPVRVESVPYVRPVSRGAYGPPPRAAPLQRHEPEVGHRQGGDLMVRFGIDSMFGRVVARVLMCFLLLQPVYVAFGAELGDELAAYSLQVSGGDIELAAYSLQVTGDASDGDTANSQLPTADSDDTANSQLQTENSDDTTSSQLPTADSVNEYPLPASPYEGEEPTDDGELAGDSLQVSGGDGDNGTANSELPTADSADEYPLPASPHEGEEPTDDGELAGDSLQVSGGDADNGTANSQLPTANSEDGATTSDEVVEEGVVEEDVLDETVASETNAGNKYTFGEGDCTLVADGEFYCVAPTAERYATGDPRVYAEEDREGDREIYYFDGVEIHRITNNSYDDFAPVFDDTTLRIAWQASIHDRMQIMVHELETNTTRQVTNARENSSNPHLLGDSLVWQQWVDTNWEVMMTDVDTTEEFDIERLSDNAVHDMFPQLYQGLITWQREKGASWEVIVYDLHTGVEHALQKSDDTKYENPRFVLMFDSKHENGDVETIGYDIETGEMMELGTRANPQPLEPITPKDEVPDAPVQTASSTLVKVKEGGEE